MTEKEKLALIYRVNTGFTFIGEYIIDTADEAVLNESFNIYQNLIKSNRFEDFVHSAQIEPILIQYKLWSIKSNAELKELDKSLDECKFGLFQNNRMPKKDLDKIRRQISLIKKQKNILLNNRHMFDEFTLEGYAEHLTDLHIFSKLILDKNYKPVNLDYCDLSILLTEYKRTLPGIDTLRLIARTDPWRSFWNNQDIKFRVNGDTQKTLSLFSRMYDSVYENPDRPEENVIADDDMLDGWFIWLKKKIDSEKKERSKNVIEQKHTNAGEIFLMAKDFDEAKEINDMNDQRGHIIRKRLDEQVKHGDVKHFDVPEFRLDAMARSKK